MLKFPRKKLLMKASAAYIEIVLKYGATSSNLCPVDFVKGYKPPHFEDRADICDVMHWLHSTAT